MKMAERYLKMGRKRCGKRRNCSLRAISPFPTVFSKEFYCRHVKTRACVGKASDDLMALDGISYIEPNDTAAGVQSKIRLQDKKI